MTSAIIFEQEKHSTRVMIVELSESEPEGVELPDWHRDVGSMSVRASAMPHEGTE
jgi:hypothetical protein